MTKNNPAKDLMNAAINTTTLGIGSMAGLGAMGAISTLPGMPVQAQTIMPLAGTGLVLANIGQLANTGMTIAKTPQGLSSSKNTKRRY